MERGAGAGKAQDVLAASSTVIICLILKPTLETSMLMINEQIPPTSPWFLDL